MSLINPADGWVQLYDDTDLTNGSPTPLGAQVQAVNGTATIVLSGTALTDGYHKIVDTVSATSGGSPGWYSPATQILIVTTAGFTYTSWTPDPANGNVGNLSLPDVVINFNHPIVGLTPDNPRGLGFMSSPYGAFITDRGPSGTFNAGDLPIHAVAVYHVNTDGTSSITLTPTQPFSTDIYVISLAGTFQDPFGNYLNPATNHPPVYPPQFELQSPTNTSELMINSVTAEQGSVVINNNQIPQPDAISINFNKPLDILEAGTSYANLYDETANSSVPTVNTFSPSTNSLVLVPTAQLVTGHVYVVVVEPTISDDQGFPNPGIQLGEWTGGATWYDTFTVSGPAVGQGQAPLTVTATYPQNGTRITSVPGYVTVTLSEPVALPLPQYSAMLIPQQGGLDTASFDPADTPLNGTETFNPNTNQIIIVPYEPMGNDIYLMSLNHLYGTNSNGTENTGDPLNNGQPYYATYQLAAGTQNLALTRSGSLSASSGTSSSASSVIPNLYDTSGQPIFETYLNQVEGGQSFAAVNAASTTALTAPASSGAASPATSSGASTSAPAAPAAATTGILSPIAVDQVLAHNPSLVIQDTPKSTRKGSIFATGD